MRLCMNPNETYASLSTDIKEIITVEDNQIKGLIGRSIDRMLASPDKRKCTVVGDVIGGEKLKNGSYTGNLGMLQKGTADMYLRFEAPLLSEDWLQMTLPMLNEKILVFEELPMGEDPEFYDLLSNLNVDLELIFCFSFCVLLFFAFKFVLFRTQELSTTSTFKLFRKFAIAFLDSLAETTSALRMTSVFYEFYIFIIVTLLTNNIKTNKVVVDTSDIIKNKDEVFETKRIACFLEHETEQKIAELFKGSILHKVLIEKTKLKVAMVDDKGVVLDRCIVKMSTGNMQIIDLADKFSLIRANLGYVTSAVASMFKPEPHAWYIGTPVYELNQVFYHTHYRIRREIMEFAMYQMTEMGIFVKAYDEMNSNAKESFNRKHPLYDNLDDYIDSNQGFDDLVLENYSNIFRLYTFSSLIILLIFLLVEHRKSLLGMFERALDKFRGRPRRRHQRLISSAVL